MFLKTEHFSSVLQNDYIDLQQTPARFTTGIIFKDVYEVAVVDESQELRAFLVDSGNRREQVTTEWPSSDEQQIALQYRNSVLVSNSTPVEITAKTLRRCNLQVFTDFFLQCSPEKRLVWLNYLLERVGGDDEVKSIAEIIELLSELNRVTPDICEDVLTVICEQQDNIKLLLKAGASDYSFINSVVNHQGLIAQIEALDDKQKATVLRAKSGLPGLIEVDGNTAAYFDPQFIAKLKPESLAGAANLWPAMLTALLLSDLPFDKAQAVLALLSPDKAAGVLYALQLDEEETFDTSMPYVLLDVFRNTTHYEPERKAHLNKRYMALLVTANKEVSSEYFKSLKADECGECFKRIELNNPEIFAIKLNQFAVSAPEEFKSMMIIVGKPIASQWSFLLTAETIAHMSTSSCFNGIKVIVFSRFNKVTCNEWLSALDQKRRVIVLKYQQNSLPFETMKSQLHYIDNIINYLIVDLLAQQLNCLTFQNVSIECNSSRSQSVGDDSETQAKASVRVCNKASFPTITDYINSPEVIATALNALSCRSDSAVFISMCRSLFTQPSQSILTVLLCLDEEHYLFITRVLDTDVTFRELLLNLDPRDFKGMPERISYIRASQLMFDTWKNREDLARLIQFFANQKHSCLFYLMAEFPISAIATVVPTHSNTQSCLMGLVPIMQQKTKRALMEQGDTNELLTKIRLMLHDQSLVECFAPFVAEIKGYKIEILKKLEVEEARQVLEILRVQDNDFIKELLLETHGMLPITLLRLINILPEEWIVRMIKELHKNSVADVFLCAQYDGALMSKLGSASLKLSTQCFIDALQKVCQAPIKIVALKGYLGSIQSMPLKISCLEQLPSTVIAELMVKDRAFLCDDVAYLPKTKIEEINAEMLAKGAQSKDLIKKL
ncbi:hypothetical protein D5018_01800 [Parashewanella curva]|uniref:Uncharacterized protein n=1 Tax=Parashewanella curva TaxID=2338552 RepID=A0A3L8Q1V0_9GAMM|nr:hypothetical protein [Parashewanella curva]RLV61450.1 hypothetical protein D5018_01800 [Parashewanella curva]